MLTHGANIISNSSYIFENKEAIAYENWLASRHGRIYVRASCYLLERILDYHSSSRILDIGCGLGCHLSYLRKKGMIVHGIEAGAVIAHLASQKLGGNVEIDIGDAHNLPYEDNSFDTVIMVNTLEFLEWPAQALAEAMRVAVSHVCIITLNSFSLMGIWRQVQHTYHPLSQGRAITFWQLRWLIHKILGPVPQTWAGAILWPKISIGSWPFAGLIGVCATIIPRYRTRPLTIKVANQRSTAQPIHGHG